MGLNYDDMVIKSADFLVSNSKVDSCPRDNRPEYAVIGRSNVGKSSLINMLTGKAKLAMTSSMPGKTLLINHFLINDLWYLVDLPGYGFAKRSKAQKDELFILIKDYILNRDQLTSLFVLIDSRLEPQKIDVEFINWLGKNQVPFSIIFTKADKLVNRKLRNNINVFLDKLSHDWEQLPLHFVTSAPKKQGKKELLDYIDNVNSMILSEKKTDNPMP